MAPRTLGIIAALGLLTPFSAYADQPGGDIVDQILKTLPPAPGRPAPMTSAAVTPPPPVTPAAPSPAPASPDPASLTPANPPASSSVAVTPLPPNPAPLPAASVTPASPGDIVDQATQTTPPPPLQLADTTAQWTGFYVGGNLGGGFTSGGSGLTCLNSVTSSTSGCDIINSPPLKASGVFGGGQIGYLMPLSGLNLPLGQDTTPPLMIGVEADMQGTGINGQQSVAGPFNLVGFPGFTCSPCSFAASQQIDWFSTVRARVGVPVDNFLIYATGGVIFGSVKASQNLNFTGTSQGDVGTISKVQTGPVAGGGIEFLLSGPFSAKIEGLYYDLGDLKLAGLPVAGAPSNFSNFKTFGFRGGLIRFGINVKLGGLGGS